MDNQKQEHIPTELIALRLSIVNENGNPVSNLVVSLYQNFGEGDKDKQDKQLLAKLQTDNSGYVSFKIENAIPGGNVSATFGETDKDNKVFVMADLIEGNDFYLVRLNLASLQEERKNLGLPSVMLPDEKDLTLSPSSIGILPQLNARGLCSQLMPTTLTTRCYTAFQVIADICHPEMLNCVGREKPDTAIVRGRMLEYEVIWYPIGTSLGNILNSITLAPCEQVDIAIMDWVHQEISSRTEASVRQEQQVITQNHDRLIIETMHSLTKNKDFSASFSSSTLAKMGIPIDTMKLDVSSVISHGVGYNSSSQSIAGGTTNNLSEKISQTANSIAIQKSSVVFQTNESLHKTIQTRKIHNPNPCHALTMMYYQVNQNYRLVTRFKGEREVILVKYYNRDFDAQRAFCNSSILQSGLIDQSLIACFEDLSNALFCCDDNIISSHSPSQNSSSSQKKVFIDSITLSFSYEKSADIFLDVVQLSIVTSNGPITLSASIGAISATGSFTHTFPVAGVQIEPSKILNAFAVFNLRIGSTESHTIFISNMTLLYRISGSNTDFHLFQSQDGKLVNTTYNMSIKAELPNIDTNNNDNSSDNNGNTNNSTTENECLKKSCNVKKLIAHLNCNRTYYNSLIWMNEDPNDRVIRWSCCSPYGLIGQIENNPITVYGDYVVFPVSGSVLVPAPIPPQVKLVTLPTVGVYAEGLLGQCNTCEKVDPDRPWD